MSMATEGYADYANKLKDEWVKKLEKAAELPKYWETCDAVRALNEVEKVINEIKYYQFTE